MSVMVDHCQKQLSNFMQERWMKLDTYVRTFHKPLHCMCVFCTYIRAYVIAWPANIVPCWNYFNNYSHSSYYGVSFFLVLKYHICVCFCSAKHAHCYGDIDGVKSLNREMRPCATCTLAHEHTHTHTVTYIRTYVDTYTFSQCLPAAGRPWKGEGRWQVSSFIGQFLSAYD